MSLLLCAVSLAICSLSPFGPWGPWQRSASWITRGWQLARCCRDFSSVPQGTARPYDRRQGSARGRAAAPWDLCGTRGLSRGPELPPWCCCLCPKATFSRDGLAFGKLHRALPFRWASRVPRVPQELLLERKQAAAALPSAPTRCLPQTHLACSFPGTWGLPKTGLDARLMVACILVPTSGCCCGGCPASS